ncbi:hypothetical protein HK105_201974 [Polyrhizophydium stewartii]|uniref:Uncharacterized protein n=1 Tax=Polyrhizophydium stewartii TaxID=2732419 RepID=A0ABR4NGB7_9FUNG
MVQSFNPAGVVGALRVLAAPSSALPHVVVPDVAALGFAALKAAGFKAIAFDKDNTLTAPYAMHIHPPFEKSWSECIDAFGQDRIAIVSNSAGSTDDKDHAEARKIEAVFGVHVLRHVHKKPAGGEELVAHFGCRPEEIVFVGDRLFTDVLYARRIGALAVLTRQIVTADNDNWAAKQIRVLEHRFVDAMLAAGFSLPPHPLVAVEGQHALVRARRLGLSTSASCAKKAAGSAAPKIAVSGDPIVDKLLSDLAIYSPVTPVGQRSNKRGAQEPRSRAPKATTPRERAAPTIPTIQGIKDAVETNNLRKAMDMFSEIEEQAPSMLVDLEPRHFTALITAVVLNLQRVVMSERTARRLDRAVEILKLCKSLHIPVELESYIRVISAMARLGMLARVKALVDGMEGNGLEPMRNQFIVGDLVRSYIIAGYKEEGDKLFELQKTLEPPMRSYNRMVKTYSLKNDEAGLLATLEAIKAAGLAPNQTTYVTVCGFYSNRNDYAKLTHYLNEFSATGEAKVAALYTLQIRMANQVEQYHLALSLIAEMRVNKVELQPLTFLQEIIALASLGEMRMAWRCVGSLLSKRRAPREVPAVLARMHGPLPNNAATLKQIYSVITQNKLRVPETLRMLMSGYRDLGDPASVQILLDEYQLYSSISTDTYMFLVRAHIVSGDIDSAVKKLDELVADGHTPGFETIYAALVLDLKRESANVDHLANLIRTMHPHMDIEKTMGLARKQALGQLDGEESDEEELA